MAMKNSTDTIGNRTRGLPTCSAVPQPTAPPRALGSCTYPEFMYGCGTWRPSQGWVVSAVGLVCLHLPLRLKIWAVNARCQRQGKIQQSGRGRGVNAGLKYIFLLLWRSNLLCLRLFVSFSECLLLHVFSGYFSSTDFGELHSVVTARCQRPR